MNFKFNMDLIANYKSNSQISRVLTENWVEKNMYCPICGKSYIDRYENNHPTGDFYCLDCNSDFELKSKQSTSEKLSKTIADGEYSTMISRITSLKNPNFFFMMYNNYTVQNFILIPNHFFTPEIIIRRNPLGPHARRAGWTGCNINISSIPESGKIFLIKNQVQIPQETVINNYKKTKTLITHNLNFRGWIMDVLSCIERIPAQDFTLNQVYEFERELKVKHPDNNHVKDKIRQQLQYLRDKGFIEFVSPGHYRKI